MASLTPRRFEAARPILDKYREQLHRTGHVDAGDLEGELRKCWNIGYQELKDIIIDLAKRDEYRYLAAYYMEHSNAPGVVTEFQGTLAALYGVESYYHAPDREEKREAFWQTMKRETE